MSAGYDIIGDIHGHADKLRALLERMGYSPVEGVYQHPNRQAIFVGDFIDRGPQQRDTVTIARRMVDQRKALAVLGNHEFNALAWYTPDPDTAGEYLRPRNPKNRAQHGAFLAEVEQEPERHADILAWFRTLPLFLDLPGLRVIHACWHDEHLAWLQPRLSAGNTLNHGLLVAASRRGDPAYDAIEVLLKGPEVRLPHPHSFRDKEGHERHHVRVRWWDTQSRDIRRSAFVDESQRASFPETLLPDDALPGYDEAKPLFVGHYWLTGKPAPLSPKVACLDYSAAKGGPLVAYRWSGEATLEAEHFCHTPS